MPPTFAHGLRACCAAVVFAFAARAAEPAPGASPIGLNHDQVIARYGEPKSQIAAGNRLVMFFAKERLVLRDGVVIEIERLPSEPSPRRPPPTPAPPVAAPPATTAPAEAAGATAPAAVAPAPGAVAPTAPPAAAPTTAPATAPTDSADAAAAASPELKLAIKSVRPPSANYTPRPITKQSSTTPPAPAPMPSAAADASARKTSPSVSATPAAPASVAAPIASSSSAAAASPTMPASREAGVATTGNAPAEDAAEIARAEAAKAEEDAKAEAAALAATAKAEKEKKLKIAKARRRLNEAGEMEEPDISEAFLTTRTFVISFLVIGGGIGFLYWRSRQRQLALAATAVSRTPFSAPSVAAAGSGAIFTTDLLAKLEWKRFEELVVAYYVKTGVVAVRTKSGPASPVHIRISWKGEPRPFACVQCLAHPQGLVDAKPLQELVAVLNAEDIRRGYVVTAGKFGVNARDFAEEKHLTLLPGDIFLEKLNALPDTARNEIMQTVSSGDLQTPSCPKCDAKMVRSTDDPAMWHCTAHPDQVIPVWR